MIVIPSAIAIEGGCGLVDINGLNGSNTTSCVLDTTQGAKNASIVAVPLDGCYLIEDGYCYMLLLRKLQ